jgi:hypothetical protein
VQQDLVDVLVVVEQVLAVEQPWVELVLLVEQVLELVLLVKQVLELVLLVE